jgi:hypothetical protein
MFEVKVTVDLGEKTVALLTGGIAIANTVKEPIAVEAEAPKAESPTPISAAKPEAPKAAVFKTEPEKRTRRTKEQIAAEEAQTANGWNEMDDDAKLDAIRSEVTKYTKKGKSADIKFLLSNFDANRASELAPEDYDAFFDAITRYGKGESVESIFPGNLN